MKRKRRKIIHLFFTLLLCFFNNGYSNLNTSEFLAKHISTFRSLNPVADFFPDSSLVDFSYLLDPPAGKHGFLKVGSDGHFYFEDGKRARFWGVVISQEHIDIPYNRIDKVVDTLARAGVNLVRLHCLDNRGGEEYGIVRRCIIDEAYPNNNNSRHFDKEYLSRVDYWIYKLKEKGIYTYLVLLGYRTFREGDGVPNAKKLDRAARPYSVFNKRLIELQKEYAEKLLFEHINPFTKLSYANDPAIAFIEIFNENGFFLWRDRFNKLVEPYATELKMLWNEWLRKRYGSTEKLKKAWTNFAGETPLQPYESLEEGTVNLPDLNLDSFEIYNQQTIYRDPLKSPARRNDACRFAAELQKEYFKEMKKFLKEKGIKVPLTAVVDSLIIPDTLSVADELDFTAENFYWDHPSYEPGQVWVGLPRFHNKDHLKEQTVWTFVPYVSMYKWRGKPVGIREWAFCYPNQYRASSILEVAVYACLQDIDMLTHFAYYSGGNVETIGSFSLQADPVRWGLFGLAAKLYHSFDVKPAKYNISIAFSDTDVYSYFTYQDMIRNIGWRHKVENVFFLEEYLNIPDTHLTIASGRSNDASYASNRTIIYTKSKTSGLHMETLADNTTTIQMRSGYLLPLKEKDGDFYFDLVEVLKNKFEPISVDSANKLVSVFYDPKRENYVISRKTFSADELFQIINQAMNKFYNVEITEDKNILRSDTGEITRDSKNGLLLVNTQQTQIIAGNLYAQEKIGIGNLEVKSQSNYGAVIITSLDNLPLSISSCYALKMVTIAENRGQYLQPSDSDPNKIVLVNSGSAPVQTKGVPSEKPTEIYLNGKKLLEAYLINGTFEMVRDGDNFLLFCDTPNTKFSIHSANKEFNLIKYYFGVAPDEAISVSNEFYYPGYANFVLLTPK